MEKTSCYATELHFSTPLEGEQSPCKSADVGYQGVEGRICWEVTDFSVSTCQAD